MRDSIFGASYPQWVLYGSDSGDPAHPCRLTASAQVLRAGWEMRFPMVQSREVLVTMAVDAEGLVFIDGTDWQACLAELMRIWQPGQNGRPPEPLDHADRPAQLPGR